MSELNNIPLSDELNAEVDRRKLAKLVADGVITQEELDNAKTYIECPKCKQIAIMMSDNICIECGESYD